jgi:hypothetical protein
MSESKLKQYLEAMERATKKHSASKKTARAALRAAGIIDAHGNLTEHYRPLDVHASPKSHSRLSRV